MARKKRRTVLLVDDETDIRTVVEELVSSRGYQVVTAKGGREAVEIMEGGTTIDLVILDLMMPEMDGYETLARVKELRCEEAPTVIMLTAKSTDRDIMKGYGVGADLYITKPFKNQVLVDAVDYVIGDMTDAEKREIETRL